MQIPIPPTQEPNFLLENSSTSKETIEMGVLDFQQSSSGGSRPPHGGNWGIWEEAKLKNPWGGQGDGRLKSCFPSSGQAARRQCGAVNKTHAFAPHRAWVRALLPNHFVWANYLTSQSTFKHLFNKNNNIRCQYSDFWKIIASPKELF